MMRFLFVGAGLLLLASAARCQQVTPFGTVVAKDTKAPVTAAIVRLVGLEDTTLASIGFTDTTGHFQLPPVPSGSYSLLVRHIGYLPLVKRLLLDETSADLGTLTVTTRTIEIPEVVTRGSYALVQKGDTTEYIADEFKRAEDHRLEDLLERLPGISVRDGRVRFRGEEITSIIVDGKPLFEGGAEGLLDQVPVGEVSRIAIYRGSSVQEEFSGFADERGGLVMNIGTTSRRFRSLSVNAGYGESGRYRLRSGGVKSDSSERFSFSGQSERSTDMSIRGGTRTDNSLFGSFGREWPAVSVNGNYSFRNTEDERTVDLERRYFPVDFIEQLYEDRSVNRSRETSQSVTLRTSITPDSANTATITPKFNYSRNVRSQTRSSLTTWGTSGGYSRIASLFEPASSGTGFSLSVFGGHRFALPGRTVSFSGEISPQNRKGSSSLLRQDVALLTGDQVYQTLRQSTDEKSNSQDLSGRLIFTEPLSPASRVAVDYQIKRQSSLSDRIATAAGTSAGPGEVSDPSASGSQTQHLLTHRVGFGAQLQVGKTRVKGMFWYDMSHLSGDRDPPNLTSTSVAYRTVLLNLDLRHSFTDESALEVSYRGTPLLPSLTQLEEIIDYSNPMLLQRGNISLRQSVEHRLLGRYSVTGEASISTFELSVSHTEDPIGTSTTILEGDSVLSSGLRLLRGTQIMEPYNASGSWRFAADCFWNVSFLPKSSGLTIAVTASYGLTPWRRNGISYSTSSLSLNPEVWLWGELGEQLNLTLRYGTDLSMSAGGPGSPFDRQITVHNGNLRCRWAFAEPFELTSMAHFNYDPNLPGVSNEAWLSWNFELSSTVFGDKRGRIAVGLYDLLDSGQKTSRMMTESFIEESSVQRYGRYVFLSFQYTWR